MTTPPLSFLLFVLDSYWLLVRDAPAGSALQKSSARAIAALTATTQGIVTGEEFLVTIVGALGKRSRSEALALFYLGRGDCEDWNDAIEAASCASPETLSTICGRVSASADYIREGIRRRSAGGV